MIHYAIIVAGGSGSRMNTDIPKQFIEINNLPVLMHTINKFNSFNKKIKIIVVLPEKQILYWKELCKKYNFKTIHEIVIGGKTRFHSVRNGLEKLSDEGIVAIHDGVRPLVSFETIQRCFEVTEKKGNAIPFIPLVDSIRKIENNNNSPADRSKFASIQTPQVFRLQLIKEAFRQKYSDDFTDDAVVLEKLKYKINLVKGNIENIKITNQRDLIIAESLIKN